MTRTLIIGWDTGSLLAEPRHAHAASVTAGPASTGSVSLESTIVRTGSGSLKVTPASGAAGWWSPDNTGGTAYTNGAQVYIRFYLRVTALPASTARYIFGNNVASTGVGVVLNPTGTLALYTSNVLRGTGTTPLNDDQKWYRVEIKSINGAQEILVDGISQTTYNEAVPGSTVIRFGAIDTVADTYTAYFDDFAMDNAAYPGIGKVALLTPISDNARAALWTGGAGGTTNLFAAVDNKPPAGVVSASASNTSQIEHAGGAAGTTDAYDANMTTYLAAGIKTTDIVNAVMPFMWIGEDAATGTKLLSMNIKSNPATTNTGSFDVAPTSGAVGTWRTNWWQLTGPIGNAPAVTIQTSPVMTVIRPETATRVASVCFMGIYVDYTPMGTQDVFVNQAVNRAASF